MIKRQKIAQIIYKKTQKTRHWIVKIIAPDIYEKGTRKNEIRTRGTIKIAKKRFENTELVGVEIGVKDGTHAENILLTLNVKKLYLIDPYEFYIDVDEMPKDPTSTLSLARKRLARFGEKVIFILKKSSEAAKDIPDKVDFVYIDGNHNYEFVKDDINRYYDKVKSTGIIGGHDFPCSDVCKAAMEFAEKKSLRLNSEKDDWWIIKP